MYWSDKSASSSLEKLDLDVANGACVRSRDQWIEEGETSSNFVLRHEKKNRVDQWIATLKDEDGVIHSDVDSIANVLSPFYSENTISSAQSFC